jgi:hypothetical protein
MTPAQREALARMQAANAEKKRRLTQAAEPQAAEPADDDLVLRQTVEATTEPWTDTYAQAAGHPRTGLCSECGRSWQNCEC